MCKCEKLFIVTPASDLYTVDTVTASSALVGSVGLGGVTDIASYCGTLYGITGGDFLQIDPHHGRGVVVGPTGASCNALAVDSDGVIYAGSGGDLATIDPNTGLATIVGPFGGGLGSSGDLAFDANGVLYATLYGGGGGDVLAIVDKNTGNATPILTFPFSSAYGLAFCCCALFVITYGGELFEVKLGSGTVEFIGKIGVEVWGATCGPCCC
jgi:hypothetical protein